MKRRLRIVLRTSFGLLLAGGLITMVLRRNQVNVVEQLQTASWGWLAVAFCLYGLALTITVTRWRLLLSVQGIHLRFRDAARLTMVGTFFSMLIPGTVSGDVVKMVYVSQHAKERTAEAVLSIMLDRVIGLLGLFIVASVSVVAAIPFLLHAPPEIQAAAWVVGAGSLGGLGAVLAVNFRERTQRLPGVSHVLALGERLLPETIIRMVRRLVRALDLYRQRRHVVARAVLLSVGIHSLLASTIWTVGRAFAENAVTIGQYFLATQVANSVAAVPLTPAGLGGRDFVLALFFKAAGADPAKAGIVAAFTSIIIASWALLGGLCFALSHDLHIPLRAEEAPVDA